MTQQEQPPYRPHDCGGCREVGVSQMIDGQWAHRWKNGNITTCLAATPSPSSGLPDWTCGYLLGHVNAPGWAGRGPSPCALRDGHSGDHEALYHLAARLQEQER